jgi:hypothetical protein
MKRITYSTPRVTTGDARFSLSLAISTARGGHGARHYVEDTLLDKSHLLAIRRANASIRFAIPSSASILYRAISQFSGVIAARHDATYTDEISNYLFRRTFDESFQGRVFSRAYALTYAAIRV